MKATKRRFNASWLRKEKMKIKKMISKLIRGILVISLLNLGMAVIVDTPAIAANCTLSTTNNMFGSTTSGYSGNSRISLSSTNNMFGSTTSGYVGNPRTSINSTNTGLTCFWNC